MYGSEPRVLLKHYLEQGLSKTAIVASAPAALRPSPSPRSWRVFITGS